MSDLPINWIETEIGNLCSLKNGRAFKPSEWQSSGLPIVRIQNLNNPASAYNYFQGEVDERNRLRGGELLFAWSGTPGTSFGAHVWCGGDAVLNQHIFRVDFDDALLDKRFFRSAINQKLSELIDVAHGGVGLRHVTKGVFERTLVALPPRTEQTRIANQLDTLLTRIQSCNDRFDAIPALLKRFRLAVLNSALVGRMTPIIDALSEPLRNGKSVRDGNGLPVLRLTALKSQIVNLNEIKYGDWSDVADTDRFLIHNGDYLVSRGNGSKDYVGRGGLVAGCSRPIAFPDTMIRFRSDVSQMLPGYLQLVWESEGVRTQIASSAKTTAGIWKVSQTDLERIRIPLPSLSQQAEIVRRVEALFALADRLEVRATAARNQAQRLSPLVLAKAFRGELVPQDPQDESAIDLLNRITADDSPAPKKRSAKAAAPGNSKVKVQGVGTRWNGEETLGAMMKLEVVPDNYLEIIISAADGISVKELWQESKLGIDDFYAQLSKEIDNGLLTVDAQDESKICKTPKSRRGQS